MKLHPNLQVVRDLLPSLSQMLGEQCEVLLNDFSRLDSAIVAIEGDVTGRKVGGAATNYLVNMLQKYGDDAPDGINYRNELPNNRVLRSSTMFIRDNNGRVLGALCINQDVTDYLAARDLLNRCVRFEDDPEAAPGQNSGEVFVTNISTVMQSLVNTEIAMLQKPVAYIQKEEKLRLVNRLEARGVFEVKGAVEYVAERLGVTNYTIYNYLKAIKQNESDVVEIDEEE